MANSLSNCVQSSDAEELGATIVPWQLELRQVSRGRFFARSEFAPIDECLVSRAHWAREILGTGVSPPGYIALFGCTGGAPLRWRGSELGMQEVALAFDGMDVDFISPDDFNLWALLVPRDKLRAHVGEEFASQEAWRRTHRLSHPATVRRLRALVHETFMRLTAASGALENSSVVSRTSDELIMQLSELLAKSDTGAGAMSERRRYTVWLRAVRLAEGMEPAPDVTTLATAAGVSARVLQLAFQENAGMSPHRFLKLLRLHRLHRNVLNGDRSGFRIGDAMAREGFREPGRTAVEFKQLFGESPSETLARPRRAPAVRLKDALRATPSARSPDQAE